MLPRKIQYLLYICKDLDQDIYAQLPPEVQSQQQMPLRVRTQTVCHILTDQTYQSNR